MLIRTLLAMVVLLISLGARAGELRNYETRYYTLHTDLSADEARYVGLRMTCMADEYAQRTRDFSGAIRQRMPFYLYNELEDYERLARVLPRLL